MCVDRRNRFCLLLPCHPTWFPNAKVRVRMHRIYVTQGRRPPFRCNHPFAQQTFLYGVLLYTLCLRSSNVFQRTNLVSIHGISFYGRGLLFVIVLGNPRQLIMFMFHMLYVRIFNITVPRILTSLSMCCSLYNFPDEEDSQPWNVEKYMKHLNPRTHP